MKRSDLQRSMLSSSFWTVIASSGGQVFSFVVFIQIARLVGPEGFGLVALAALLIDLMQMVSSGGVADAVIQRPDLSDRDADTAFWANLGSGVVFFLVAMAASHPLALLFRTPDLAWVIQVLSATFLVSPIGAIHAARLARTFGFKSLAIRSLASNLLGGIVAIVVAHAGGGVTALIVQRLLTVVSMAVISWLGFRWVPRFRFDPAAFRPLMHYGLRVMGSQILSQLSTRSVELIAGFVLGPAAVGLIRVANRCVEMLIQVTVLPFQQVALPALSRSQSSVQAAKTTYIQLSQMSGLLIFPAFGGAFALAPTLIPLAFGVQWQDASALMQVILLTAVALQCSVMIPAALGAAGHPGQVLGWSAAQLVLSVILCSLGALFGPMGVVIANVARAYAMLPFGLSLLRRKLGLGTDAVFGGIVRPFGIAVIMTIGVLLLHTALQPTMRPIPLLLVCIAAGLALYFATAFVLMRKTMIDMGGMLPLRAQEWLRIS